MQLGTLRMLCDVAVTQSFTDAARLHDCTPASASQSFHALKRKFDLPLSEPGLRRVHLNPVGQVCYDYCRHIVGLEDTLVDELNQIRAGSGTLEVAACPCIGLYRLPPLIRTFQQACPGITVRVRHESHDGVHQAVRYNRVDAGLVPYPRPAAGLAVGIFRRVPLVLARHPKHTLAAHPVATVWQFLNRPVVVWNQIPWPTLLAGVRVNERHFYELRHAFDAVEPAIEAVMADLGVAVLPASLCGTRSRNGGWRRCRLSTGGTSCRVAAIHRRCRKLPPALRQFSRFLQQPQPGEIPSLAGAGAGGAAG